MVVTTIIFITEIIWSKVIKQKEKNLIKYWLQKQSNVGTSILSDDYYEHVPHANIISNITCFEGCFSESKLSGMLSLS